MNLPAFLLSKSFVPDPFGGPDFHRGILPAEDLGYYQQQLPLKTAHKIQNPASSAGPSRHLF